MEYGDSVKVVAASLGCAAFAELVSWLFVYRTQRYKSLNQELQRLSKRLESRKIASRSANNKKIDRLDESVKSTARQLSITRSTSFMVVSLCLFILYQSLARIYGGRVVAKLPFEPHPFLARITHRGLSGDDITDCSMAFLYLLGSLAFRQNLQKFLGSAPPPEVQAAMAELFAPRPS